MRCPFAKDMRSRAYASLANRRRTRPFGRSLESKIPFPLTFRFLPTARDSRVCDGGPAKARIREPCKAGIDILTVCAIKFTRRSPPKVFFPYLREAQRSHTMGADSRTKCCKTRWQRDGRDIFTKIIRKLFGGSGKMRYLCTRNQETHRGVEQLVARQAHNLEVVRSSRASATQDERNWLQESRLRFVFSEPLT